MDKLKKMVKNNEFIYKIFLTVGTILTKIIEIVTPVNEKQIMFISYGGTKIDDSPFYIYQEMLKDPYFKDYSFVWAVTKEAQVSGLEKQRTKIVSSDRLSYFKYLYESKIWITNTTMFRGLKLQAPKKVIYLNTWHGTPLKKIGSDSQSQSNLVSFHKNNKEPRCVYLTQSSYEAAIFQKVFKNSLKKTEMTGLPRNDILVSLSQSNINVEHLLSKMSIETNREIVLYAPTFRDYDDSKYLKNKIELIEGLSKKYYVLYRGHHASKDLDFFENIKTNNFLNVSNYPEVNDLLVISDALITDYSSICIDFSILDKPVYFFTYDLKEYSEKRGLYIDFEKTFHSIHFSAKFLLEEITRTKQREKNCENTEIIKELFLEELGKGTENAINLIKQLEKEV